MSPSPRDYPDRVCISESFRRLAEQFKQEADRCLSQADFGRSKDRRRAEDSALEEAGQQLISAFEKGMLVHLASCEFLPRLVSLPEYVSWYKNEDSPPPKGAATCLKRSPANVFVRVCGKRMKGIDNTEPPVHPIDLKFSVYENLMHHSEACRILARLIEGNVSGETDDTKVTTIDNDRAKAYDHSTDFRSVRWSGKEFTLTKQQAAIVQILWDAWEKRTPDVGVETLLESIGSESRRIVDSFRNQAAWKTMIVSGATKGTLRIAGDPPES